MELQRIQAEVWMEGIFFGALLVISLFFLFQVKHLAVDFFVQNRFPYMWMNKGKLFHPGGWLHAGSHGLASMFILLLMYSGFLEALCLSLAETVIHFLIDFFKVRIGQSTGWKCNTSPYFWDLLGIDQFLHQLTYIGMVSIWVF